MFWEKTKRGREGVCNICGKETKLTWDHVPPSGCGNRAPVEIRTVMNALCSDNPTDTYQISQNGSKFRHICKDCNEKLLGHHLDPALIDFCNAIIGFVKTSLVLPDIVEIPCKPNAISRAVFGHLIAARKFAEHRSKFDDLASEAVINRHNPINQKLNCFYWIHPYMKTLIFRDFIIRIADRPAYCQLLAFFPIAFLITDISSVYGLPSLSNFSNIDYDFVANVPLPLRPVHPFGWPWHPDFASFVFAGDEFQHSQIVNQRLKR